MNEYLINVVMAAASYWMLAFVVFAIGFVYRKKIGDIWSILKVVSLILVVIGLFIGMSSPSNTYKNTVDYNREGEINRIRQLNAEPSHAVVEDNSRQPQSVEDRAASAVDMRDRIKLNPGN